MLRRVLFAAAMFLAFLLANPAGSRAAGTCDNSDPCISYCTIVDSEGHVRIYRINRCGL